MDRSAGLEKNEVLEWNHWNGVKHWSGPVTTFPESFRHFAVMVMIRR